MSFPKAKMKRFNEVENDGVPPVGSYDPKLLEKSCVAPFTKSMRFKNSDSDLSDASSESASSKKTSTPSTVFKVPRRSNSFTMTAESGKVRQCELEIKRLLNERSSLLKKVASKEEDVRKVDAKLLAAQREKTSLHASLASFERENKELRRMSEILTMKVSTIETTGRKKDFPADLLALKEKLIMKEHEICDLRSELTQVRRELEQTIMALVDKNEEFSELQKTFNLRIMDTESLLESTKSQLHDLQLSYNDLEGSCESTHKQLHELMEAASLNEGFIAELQCQKSGLLAELSVCQKDLEAREKSSVEVIESLRRENFALLARVDQVSMARQRDSRIMSAELDNAHQKLQSTEDCSRALQEYRDTLVGRVASLRETIAELEEQQSSDLNTIKAMKVEVMSESCKLAEKDSALMAANSEITSLKEQINELQKFKTEVVLLTDQKETLRSELLACTKDKEQFLGECFVIRLQLQAAEQEVADSSRQLLEIKSKLFNNKETASALEQELSDLKASTHSRMTDFAELTQDLQQEIQAKERTIVELTDKIEESSTEYASKCEALHLAATVEARLKMQIADLEAKLEIKEVDIVSLKTKLDSQKIEKQFLKVKLETEKAELERNLSEESKVRCEAEKERMSLQRKVDELENVDDLNRKYELVIAGMEGTVECLLSELIAQTMESDVDSYELMRAQEERDALDVELQFAKDEVAHREVENAAVAEMLEEKSRHLCESQSALENLKREIENLEAVASDHEMIKDHLAVTNEKLDNETKSRQELQSIVQVRDETIAHLQSEVGKAGRQIGTLEFSRAELLKEKTVLEEHLQCRMNELEAMTQVLQQTRANNERTVSQLRDDLRNLEAAKHDAEMQFRDARNIRRLLHGELRTAQRELQETEDKLQASERMRRDLEESVSGLRQAEAVHVEKLSSARDQVERAEVVMDTQKREFERLTSEAADKDTAIGALQQEVTRLALAVDEKEVEVVELRAVVEKNQQLMVDNAMVNELTSQLTALSEANDKQNAEIETLQEELRASDANIKQHKSEIERQLANVEWHCDRERELRKKLEATEEKSKVEQNELKKSLAEVQMTLSTLEADHLVWKKMYEDLQAKVEPFMEQLNTYEFERHMLLNKNDQTKSDLERLSSKYAMLLGHQNHRQKIHHLMKLKDDNLTLKEENDKLRSEVHRLRKSASYRSGTPRPAAMPRAAFDSASKVFKHPADKENASPLRDRNVF